MSFSSPLNHIDRLPVVGEEAEFSKMFDPPKESPTLPEPLNPTNPVPEVVGALGIARNPPSPLHTVQRTLLNRISLPTWDGRPGGLQVMAIADPDLRSPFGGGQWPGPAIRVPRGTIFHCAGKGQTGPHTLHWHGLEPTPMNDGVGHTSMEIGDYIYQFQPNFIGTYFYHCHRNTVQHFEFGLYGMFIVEPPDAYFASIASTNPDGSVVLNDVPVGACSDRQFRTAANLLTLPPAFRARFPGFVGGDPVFGVAGAGDQGVGHPHAFTVPYQVEAIWVFDDRDSRWSDLASGHEVTFPRQGTIPGVDDNFSRNPGDLGFFAFNDFRPDYFFVTGVPIPAVRGPGSVGDIPGGIVIPRELNSGRTGSQVSVNAGVGQTILLRVLDGAYNNTRITFPVDVTIIAWDGRALGVPPYGRYNQAFVLPRNTPITISVARRFDALIRESSPVNALATVEFLDTRGGDRNMTARIPIVIS
ncbi:MAG: multicopper oxidase domain-containing protein [Syntrophobacteraceae bacterium]|jgi:hypothetical protein|nr:multicopper oxidase domain-containing protein [Syntrophobacteraceae bacterium]